nr:MAG TPA: hypothetical protein [Caudoviricetes sp.]
MIIFIIHKKITSPKILSEVKVKNLQVNIGN